MDSSSWQQRQEVWGSGSTRTVPMSLGTLWGLVLVPSLDFQGCHREKVLVCEKPVAEMVSSRCVCTGISV